MRAYNIEASGNSQNGNTQSKRLSTQALCYVGAFYASWIFPTIFQLVIVIGHQFPFWLLLLTVLSVPTQGFLNLLVFVRPKFLRYQKDNPNEFYVIAFCRCLRSEITRTNTSTQRTFSGDTVSSQGTRCFNKTMKNNPNSTTGKGVSMPVLTGISCDTTVYEDKSSAPAEDLGSEL
jgi:hypothetical protein